MAELLWYVNVPVVNMRLEPTSHSEVVSQALFSESVIILEQADQWQKIATGVDGYQGWIQQGALTSRLKPFPGTSSYVRVNRCAAHLYHTADTIYGPVITLPFESCLEIKAEVDQRWLKVVLPDQSEAFAQRGDVKFDHQPLSLEEMCQLSHDFLGLPYTWGGRGSLPGFDCSGFIQMLFRQQGVFLPRDAYQQYDWAGARPIPLTQLQAGDLLFWGSGSTAIKHVGLCLDHQRFIHTSAVTENKPYVRISSLEDAAWNGSGYYPYVAARRLSSF